jgi:hypothetical protein
MNTWLQAAKSGLASGTTASTLSSAVLAARSKEDTGSAYAGTNAISHALWGERAASRNAPSVKYTLAGYLIHQSASLLWATLYERFAADRYGRRSAGRALAAGAAVAAVAFVVDYTITPPRFRPGYEKRISGRSLAMVYVALAVGLAMRDVLSAAGGSGRDSSRRPDRRRLSAPASGRSVRGGSRATWP